MTDAQVASIALTDEQAFSLVALGSDSRRDRQKAAAVIAETAKTCPASLAGHCDVIVQALEQPEARTRCECLKALAELVVLEPDACDAAVPGAEFSLFDEDNGLARLAAFTFLCAYAGVKPENAVKVWPLISEAILCYHGDDEFMEMLTCVVRLSERDLGPEVSAALVERMSFDAANSRGTLKHRAQQIIDNLQK